MKKIKEEIRDAIIEITAEKMAPILTSRIDASKAEMIETFKQLIDLGRVKIGIMPFNSGGEEKFHSVTLAKLETKEQKTNWMALETGNSVELDPELERVFTMTEEQYRQIYADNSIN